MSEGVSADAGPSHSSLSSINAQLIAHGWAKRPLNLAALSERDHNEVIAVLFDLVGAGVANLSTLDSLSARHRTLTYEHERLHKSLRATQLAQGRLESETTAWKARCTDMEKRLNVEEVKVKELREEVNRGRKAVDSIRVAAGHETKKIQIKLDKALAQLAKLSNDASLLSRPQGMMLLNPIARGKTAPAAIGTPPLLEQGIRDLAALKDSLQEETEAFRHVVVSTGNNLRDVLALASGQEGPARMMHSQFFAPLDRPSRLTSSTIHQATSSTSHAALADARLKTLVSEIQNRVINPLPPSTSSAGEPGSNPEAEEAAKVEEREREKRERDLEDKVKDLETEVFCARAREEEARRVVEEMARLQEQKRKEVAEGIEAGADMERDLRRERESLDAERRKFAEATVRFAQERRQLEADRQAFLDERRQRDMDDMAVYLPPTPAGGIPAPPPMPDHAEPTSPHPHPASSSSNPPSSPSPPLRASTPKSHHHHPATSSRRKAKTPLSRLVLEKGLRQKHREGSTALEREIAGLVLGEGGRRGNASASSPAKSKGKGAVKARPDAGFVSGSTSGSSSSGAGGELGKSTVKGGGAALRSSQLGQSVRRGEALGVGPRTASKSVKVWR